MEKEFNISSQIYSLEKVQQAILDFTDICEIVYKNNVLIISGDSSDDIQEVFQEFMNYVLSL